MQFFKCVYFRENKVIALQRHVMEMGCLDIIFNNVTTRVI